MGIKINLGKEEGKNRENKANDVKGDPQKQTLYESIADVAKLKADELRLKANLKPESELARNILEEKTKNNILTRFKRFKEWAKRNLGGISVFAISVAGIITTIVMGMKTVVKKGANATSKLGKFLGKLAEKVGPVLGSLLNLAAGLLRISIYRFRASVSGDCFAAKTSMWLRAIVRVTKCLHTKARIFSKCNGPAVQTVSSKGRSFVNGRALSNELRSLIVDKCPWAFICFDR